MVCDDSSRYYREMMKDLWVNDGLVEHELDLKRQRQVINHILSILVQQKENDGGHLDGLLYENDMRYMRIIRPMFI